MPQSLAHVIIHLVFGTKNRRPVLVQPYRARVHAYLATLSRELQCECYRVGGVEDHVHMAIRLHRTVAIADLVEHVKARSSTGSSSRIHRSRISHGRKGTRCSRRSTPMPTA